jgi:hypothetical protein
MTTHQPGARIERSEKPTMAQRISRAKQSIKNSGIPFQLPTTEERVQRLRAVLHVLYLIFNFKPSSPPFTTKVPEPTTRIGRGFCRSTTCSVVCPTTPWSG